MQQLVSHCPPDVMSYDLQLVALSLLEEGCQDIQRQLESGKVLEPGSVLRYAGRCAESPLQDTEPVMFLSAPYLHLREERRTPTKSEDFVPMTLLQSLYGYDLGYGHEGSYVAEKLDPSHSGKKIYVPQLWCLLIGSGKWPSDRLGYPPLRFANCSMSRHTGDARRMFTCRDPRRMHFH